MKKIYILNGRILDPSVSLDRTADLVISGGVIEGIYDCGTVSPEKGSEIIDAAGIDGGKAIVTQYLHRSVDDLFL